MPGEKWFRSRVSSVTWRPTLDLFGRKAQAENLHLREALAKKSRKLSISKGINQTYRAKIDLLEARIVAQKEDIQRLLDHNRLLASQPLPQRSITPLHVSEEEEDVQYAMDTELVDPQTAKLLMQALQLESSNVDLPEEYDETELNDLTLTI